MGDMKPLKMGELFAGYGGLGSLGIGSVLPVEPAWFCEFDKAPSAILAHHWADVPNLGDITAVDWSTVEPVDVLTGGYPCQPFSHAGRRQGVEDDRHLWPYVADGIAFLRPPLCVFENVRGHLSLGYDVVLRDLQQLGYRVHWITLRAADVGAPHGRARLFIFAEDSRNERSLRSRPDRRGGVDRHSANHLVLSGAPQDQHDRQGSACTGSDGGGLWRTNRSGATGGSTRAATHDGLGCEWRGGRRTALEAAPAPTGEGCCCGRGPGVSRNARLSTQAAQSRTVLDRPDARSGGDADAPHPGGEPAWAGSGPAETAQRNADRGLPLGLVVGAGGRPLRPGRVPGEAADLGLHGGGACVCTTKPVDAVTLLLPTPTSRDHKGHNQRGDDTCLTGAPLPTPRATDGTKGGPNQRGSSGDLMLPSAVQLLPTPSVADSMGGHLSRSGERSAELLLPGVAKAQAEGKLLPTPMVGSTSPAAHGQISGQYRDAMAEALTRWGDYAPAIARWEHATGRTAPAPTELGKNGNPRLSPIFVEWLMGLPEGHVTDPAIGLTRNAQLKALGNGVVPQQAAEATRWWLAQVEAVSA